MDFVEELHTWQEIELAGCPEFENQIILPNNNYQGIENNKIEPNILGNVGEKIEGVIDKAIDKAKDVLKKIVD